MSQRYAFALSLKFNPYIITRQYFQPLNYYVFLKYLRIPAFMKRPPIYFKIGTFLKIPKVLENIVKKRFSPREKGWKGALFYFWLHFCRISNIFPFRETMQRFRDEHSTFPFFIRFFIVSQKWHPIKFLKYYMFSKYPNFKHNMK